MSKPHKTDKYGVFFGSYLTFYVTPRQVIVTDNLISQNFRIYRGNRQGYPLPPSLFALYIKPIAAAECPSNIIKGICRIKITTTKQLYKQRVHFYLIKSIKETHLNHGYILCCYHR